jgi:hypothetical protein
MKNSPALRRSDFLLNAHVQSAWEFARSQRQDPYLFVEQEKRLFPLFSMYSGSLSWVLKWRRCQWRVHGRFVAPSHKDISRLYQALDDFHRVQKFLPAERRDISSFKTLDELAMCEFILDPASTARLKKVAREQAYRESSALFRDGRWAIIQLHSKAAATWWGMGTRWCTAARERNAFERYTSLGPLYILLSPDGKFQAHPATSELRDEADREVDLKTLIAGAPAAFASTLEQVRQPADSSLKFTEGLYGNPIHRPLGEPEEGDDDWEPGWFWELEPGSGFF